MRCLQTNLILIINFLHHLANQKYIILTQDKESAAYKEMYERYVDLKAILNASGVNLTELDRIKE